MIEWERIERFIGFGRRDVAWRDEGPFRVGESGRTRVILTTRFRGRGFNADEQLAELARVALCV